MNLKESCKRSKARLCGTIACCLLIGPAAVRTTSAQQNVVLQWNSALLQAVRNTRFAPVFSARALAIVHTSMYDAWAAYDSAAVGTRYGAALRRPPRERTLANKQEAVSYAAYRALVDLFPSQQADVFDPLMTSLGFDPDNRSSNIKKPSGVGNVTAAAVLAYRHDDGSNQLGDLHPGAYSDYTGYTPVNDPEILSDPNRWQPLRNGDGTAQKFLAPHWGLVIPFALDSSTAFLPDRPALYPRGGYREQAGAIVRLSADLDDWKKVIAEYWADGPATETPPGHWNRFAQFVSERDGHTLDQDVKLFFALGNALLDTSIAVWECKRFYDYVRPVSAVRFLYAGKVIRAWAGPYQGTQLITGEHFQTYIPTPPFAEYVSGHSTFSAASAEILKSFTGSDDLGASVTIAAGSSNIEPGTVPAHDITLSWTTFSEAADQAGISRRYGGIHFEQGDLAGRALGRKIGRVVWEKTETYLNGTAAP